MNEFAGVLRVFKPNDIGASAFACSTIPERRRLKGLAPFFF